MKKILSPLSELKELGKPSKDYLDTDDFAEFLIKKKIIVRKDNLPRFADIHGIKMARKKERGLRRVSSYDL